MGLQKKIFDFLHSQDSIARYRKSSQDFIRSSPLSFPVIATSILRLFKESVEYHLQEILPALGSRPVTGSAFAQGRYKIDPIFFRDLNRLVTDTYRTSAKKLWKGHVLLAGDGTTLNLPSSSDIREYFGVYSTNEVGLDRYLARVFFLYDVLNDFVVESRLSTMDIGEKTLMRQCLPLLGEANDIMLLDRGFGNFCTVKELANSNISFCIRLGLKNSMFAKAAFDAAQEDFITVWCPSEKEKANCRKNGLDVEPVAVRLVKIKLKTGETELLVTSLCDLQKYTTQEIGQLYALRWGVEEGFKNLKPKMKIEHFGCKKAEGVFQEFYAHIFYINMVGLTGLAAESFIKQKTMHRKWEYTYNWKNAYKFLRAEIIKILRLKEIEAVFDKLIAKISSCLIALKPGREFVRDTRHKNKRGRISQFNK